MTLQRKLYLGLAAYLACSSPYLQSETIYGTARVGSTAWVMQNVLPQQAGLTVGNVIYRYTAVKDPADPMLVHVQNEDTSGEGYIFRETDDWSGLPGNKIYKVVAVGDIPLERWGDGSIEVEGVGSVEDPSVVYTYKYDPCFDPQSNPDCPGYKIEYDLDKIIPVVEFQDPLEDEIIVEELEKETEIEEEEESERKIRIAQAKEKLEKLLGGVNSAAMSEQALAQEAALFAMNYIPVSYTNALDGGYYEDVPMLKDGNLPSNKKALRVGLAQQKLHEDLIQSQYDN